MFIARARQVFRFYDFEFHFNLFLRHLAGFMRFHVNPHSVCRFISRIALGLINPVWVPLYVRFDWYGLKIAKIFPQIFLKLSLLTNEWSLTLELVGNILGLDSRGREVSLLIKSTQNTKPNFFVLFIRFYDDDSANQRPKNASYRVMGFSENPMLNIIF